MSLIIALAGSPSASSRTVALFGALASGLRTDGHQVRVLPVRALPAEALLGADASAPAIAEAIAAVAGADGLIVGSPVYKAAYSGVLKTFLDLLPADALAGKAVLPVLTGAAPAHALAVDQVLAPVLTALGARHVVSGLFLLDKQIRRIADGAVLAPEARDLADAAIGRLVTALVTALPAGERVRR